jgi:hypothetical protein
MKMTALVCLLFGLLGAQATPRASTEGRPGASVQIRSPEPPEETRQVTIHSTNSQLGLAFSCSAGKPLFLIAPIEGRFTGAVVPVEFRFGPATAQTLPVTVSGDGQGGYIYGAQADLIRTAMEGTMAMRVRTDSTEGELNDVFDLVGVEYELRKLSCLRR